MRILPASVVVLALSVSAVFGAKVSAVEDAITAALSADETVSQPAIEALRNEGVAAVDRLMQVRKAAIAEQNEGKTPAIDIARLNEVIDAVGRQRYCYVSGIYWHTDLNEAIAEAQRTGKPIVSLHMLGNLTEELSCANSRFFRTTLYSNQEISAWLKENCVMHWKSVRPVPKITIDFGDGRKLVRTVTGNSAHYVLDTSGQPVDCIPGLYGPAPFLEHLKISHAQAQIVSKLNAQKHEAIATYHRKRLDQLARNWQSDLQEIGYSVSTAYSLQYTEETRERLKRSFEGKIQPQAGSSLKTELKETPVFLREAAEASARAVPKNDVERPLLAAMDSRLNQFVAMSTEEVWTKLAALHAKDAEIDGTSFAVIASENPTATAAMAITRSKGFVESPLVKMLKNLKSNIAMDTVRNEYELHRQIHEWFIAEPTQDLTALNRRVYAELFLTPDSDPWLGLAPSDAYSAIPNNGYVQEEE